MTFGEMKHGDKIYLIDYNQFKIDLTFIEGIVQSIVVNEPPKDQVYQQMLQKPAGHNQPITITALFNGIPFSFTVTREMVIAKANDRTICLTKNDVLQEIRIRKTEASNKIKSLDRFKRVVEECEKIELEVNESQPPSSSPETIDRLTVLENKFEKLLNTLNNGQVKTTNVGAGTSSEAQEASKVQG